MQTVALIWLLFAEFKGRQDGIQAGGGERRWHIHPSCHSVPLVFLAGIQLWEQALSNWFGAQKLESVKI